MKTNLPCRIALVVTAGNVPPVTVEEVATALRDSIADTVHTATVEPGAVPDVVVALVGAGAEAAELAALNDGAWTGSAKVVCAIRGAATAESLTRTGWSEVPHDVVERDVDGTVRVLDAPVSDLVMPYVWQAVMIRLRAGYWAEATRQPPRTPASVAASGPVTVQLRQPARRV